MTHDNKSQSPKTSNNAAVDRLTELKVGYSDSVTRTITAKDVETFASLSGDQNPLHMDDEFAARTEIFPACGAWISCMPACYQPLWA